MSSTLRQDQAKTGPTTRRPAPAPPSQAAAALSHDMKTPLGAIELYNSLLREMAHDDPERAAFHEMITNQVRRLAQMADSVGSQTEKDAPQARLHVQRLSLRRLLADTLELYRQMYGDRGYAFLLDAPDTLRPVVADRDALSRVLANLLDNAVKYSRPHTISVRIYEARRPLAPFTILEITDQGRGIAHRHRKRLFDPYYRVDAEKDDGGRGLGLSIARDIVQAHGGHMEVDSTPGSGSTFRVLLPMGTTSEPSTKLPDKPC